MKNKLQEATEHELQTMIGNYLKFKGWKVLRLNTGKYLVGVGRSRRYVMGQDAGTPDLLAFKSVLAPTSPADDIETRQTRLIFVEIKKPGKKPTVVQEAKMEELELYGARCYVATSIEDLQKVGI